MPDGTRGELRRLAGRYGLVACVTGRSSELAREIVGVDELTYVGEHGLELDPAAQAWAGRIHGFAAEVPWPATEVKPLSVAFHYRNEPDPELARQQLEPVAAAALGARLSHTLGPHGARGAAADRRVEGHGGASAARGERPDARALRGRRHHRPRRLRRTRRPRGGGPGRGRLGGRPGGARRACRPRASGRPRRSPSCSRSSRGRAARAAAATGGARRRAPSCPRRRAAGETGPARRGARPRPCRG